MSMTEMHQTLWTPQEFAQNSGVPHIVVPTAVYLDWDRTAGAINEKNVAGEPIGAMPRLLAVAALEGIDPDEILAEQAEVELTRSYDALGAVAARLQSRPDGDTAYARMRARFVSSDITLPSAVYDDTKPFLRGLRQARIPHGVYTAGQNETWQADKVASGNYAGYVKIMPMTEALQSDGSIKIKSPAKGPTIDATLGVTGTYDSLAVDRLGRMIAVVSAESAVLIDDKVESAKGMPVGSSETLIIRRPGEKVSDRQKGDMPNNGSIITELPGHDWLEAHRPNDDYGRAYKFYPLATTMVRHTSD